LDLSFNPLKQLKFNQSNLFRLKSLNFAKTNSNVISKINFELLPQLEELDLSDNLNINTNQLKYLINLKKLNLKNTNIDDCSFVSSLIRAEEIDVSNNKNYYSCIRYIRNYLNLKSLKISNISLKSTIYEIGDFVYNLKALTSLDASLNNISTMNGINKITNLINLDLKFNMIVDINIDKNYEFKFNFHKLSKLEFVNLNQSLAKNLINFELKFGNSLEHAILSANDLKIFPKFCEQFFTAENTLIEFSCNLKILYFDNNKLDRIKQINLIYLENLEYFNLDSNEISLVEDSSFYNQKLLETLILSNNKLDLVNNTDVLFNTLTNIKLINLSSNYIEIIQEFI
jgi:Leucine-rich repeat (LRR) protein